jgi:folate-dependent phosphoribosylglycinamide formyltransferase PurN/peptidoglycan/xylan/chitin deacetylase (PgdA/CDA1 family)
MVTAKTALVTTGLDARHAYFLARFVQRCGGSIKGIIIQKPPPAKPRQSQSRFHSALSEKWIKLHVFWQGKLISLRARMTFRTSHRRLSRLFKERPVFRTQNINSAECLSFIRNTGADLLVVFGGRIISKEVIREFPSGILNLHLGLSPEYKGGHCIEWPLYHRKPEMVGVTVHFIDEGIDSGNLIAQAHTHPRPGENPGSVIIRTIRLGIHLLVETAEKAIRGEALPSTQQEKGGFCYYERQFAPEIRYAVWRRARQRSVFQQRLSRKIRRDLFHLASKGGIHRKFFPHLPYPAVMLYHDIGPGDSPYLKHCGLSLSVKRFREHVNVLSEFYRVISVREVFERCCAGIREPDTIAFSFDDGYRGILDAFSILKEKGFPATAYINPDFASKTDLFWRSKLSFLVEKYPKELRRALEDRFGKSTELARGNFFDWSKGRIQDPLVEQEISRVYSEYGDDLWKKIYASWDELKSVESSLFHFGSHTSTHLCLSSLSKTEQEQAIRASKAEITKHLGDTRVGFSIPFGEAKHFNNNTLAVVEEAHDFFLTAHGGLNVVGLGREVRRIGVPDVEACQLPRLLWENL